MTDNQVIVSFTAQTDQLDDAIRNLRQSIQGIGSVSATASDAAGGLFKSMQQAADGAVRGILLGTQSWSQAMSRLFGDVLASFVNTMVVNRALQWAKSEVAMTAASVEGNAARAASDETASSVSLGAKAAQAASTILNDAKQVFAGVFSFLAPALGPAAAGPAASASASVAALAGGITYAENGAWNIPSNTLAYLHAGEMVVPQSFASQWRGGQGGMGSGGDNYSITIQAIDAQTGAQFLKNNAGVIVSALAGQVRGFNPLTRG
jgi:hypothetical protein